MDYKLEYQRWLDAGATQILHDEDYIKECFGENLKFGTGGIRAIMGPGPNRLNIYTIKKASEGFAKYISSNKGHSIVIAYDNRLNSKEFAYEAAKVISTHGIKVFLFDDLRPTPELSFAVRYLKASGGIVITASHNPPEYNGFKTYDCHGCQSVPRDTDNIIKWINDVKDILNIVSDNDSNIELIGKDIDDAYYASLLSVQERPNIDKNITVAYTPLHGTGYVPVTKMLTKLGYTVLVADSQCRPNPSFINAKSVNPEDRNSFDEVLKLDADIYIATDPDSDRLGVVCNNTYLTGNQTGAILIQYLLSTKLEKGTLPSNGIIFDTIVTGSLGAAIAKSYGIEVESTLTGFKYIGDKIRQYEGEKEFLFGYEESYGCLIKDFCRDKDAIQAIILLCEACQYYKNQGKTLVDVLNSLYEKFGNVEDCQEYKTFNCIDAMKKIDILVNDYRYGDISEIEGRKIIAKEDYLLKKRFEENNTTSLNLPKSNVIKFILDDGSWVAVRPSGNEPKIKIYKNLIS